MKILFIVDLPFLLLVLLKKTFSQVLSDLVDYDIVDPFDAAGLFPSLDDIKLDGLFVTVHSIRYNVSDLRHSSPSRLFATIAIAILKKLHINF